MIAMTDWVYLENAETGGSTRVPDEPGVVEWHEAHGWARADEPEVTPFVPPATSGATAYDDGWLELVHPETGGTQRLPNNPEALEGAYDAGWVLKAEADQAEAEELVDERGIKDVLAEVGDDPEKARLALEAERAGRQRKTLIEPLEALASEPPDEDAST